MAVDFTSLAQVVYSDAIVLTSKQLAEFYGCKKQQIKQNFGNNKKHFVEGVHYFKLEGEELKEFKDAVENFIDFAPNFDLVSKSAKVLYLWTKRGAARHAKMLSTNRAWEVYELLEENYFERKAEAETVSDTKCGSITVITAANVDTKNDTPVAKNLPPHLTDDHTFCIYAALLADYTVKIGMSCDVFRRANELKNYYKLDIINLYHTGKLPAIMAKDIEKTCHCTLSAFRVKSEVYNISFADACATVSENARTIIQNSRALYVKN